MAKYEPKEFDIPTIIRNGKRKQAGRRAKKSGTDAEQAFDDCNVFWERSGTASFNGGHPPVKFIRRMTKNNKGATKFITIPVVTNMGSVDRIGNVGYLSVRVEIKSSEGTWYPKLRDKTFVNEFQVLQTGARTGALSFFLVFEKKKPHFVTGKWWAIPIDGEGGMPDREDWIPINLIEFPEFVKRFHHAKISRKRVKS